MAGLKYQGIVPRPFKVEAMKMNLFAERVFCHEVYIHLSFLNARDNSNKKEEEEEEEEEEMKKVKGVGVRVGGLRG